MAVFGGHAIADDLGALRQILRQRDEDTFTGCTHGCIVARSSLGVDQLDECRPHRLVEPQPHRLRRHGQNAAIAGIRRNQRGVRGYIRGKADNQQQRHESGGKAHLRELYGFGINLTPGAGDVLSWEWTPASAGISIQRLTPCSHSCTTGKYSVVFGLRPSVR